MGVGYLRIKNFQKSGNYQQICFRVQNGQEVEMDLQLGWFSGSQSNLKPFPASKMIEKCLNEQSIPKNAMLGTKNIKIGPLGPELAHTKCSVGKMAITP